MLKHQKMEKVIITGGLGFIGSNLINILKNKYYIINVDKVNYASNFKNCDRKSQFIFENNKF